MNIEVWTIARQSVLTIHSTFCGLSILLIHIIESSLLILIILLSQLLRIRLITNLQNSLLTITILEITLCILSIWQLS